MFDLPLKKMAFAFGFFLSGSAWAGYAIIDMGTLGGTYSEPVKVNSGGDAVGAARTSSNLQHAFFYNAATGAISDVHPTTLGSATWRSYATANNDNGQIVGAFGQVSVGPDHAFVLDVTTGAASDLGTLGGSFSVASDINSSGVVVGGSTMPGNAIWHAFTYSGGTMTDIGGLPGYSISQAKAINSSGDVVGNSWSSSTRAFLYTGGAMVDIGTLGGSLTWAQDINDNQQIVGSSNVTGDVVEHAFLYSSGTMTDIGALIGAKSVARGINNNGDIVGQYYTGQNASVIHPFLYSNGTVQDINTLLPAGSGWTLLYATDINDLGMIVGVGTINGEGHGFLMVPGCGE